MHAETAAPSFGSDLEIQSFSEARVRWTFRLIAISLGAMQAWAGRNAINPDGRSHLEIARAYLRHDWTMAINAYWGPLYSWVLSAALGLGKPGLRTEFLVVHVVNFALFLLCIFAFEFFLRELIVSSQAVLSGISALSPSILWIMGYALFIWLSTGLLVPLVNADLCVATVVFVDLALLLKINTGQVSNAWTFVAFGGALGVGYMAKAVMFPLGFVLLALSAISCQSWAKRRSLTMALMIFLCLFAPQIFLLSRATHHLTFSESGRYVFAWSNYNLPIRNWQGQPPFSGRPLHPTRKIYDHPAIFEFNGPIPASYPPWYDPSYWNAGMAPPFRIETIALHALSNTLRMGAFFLLPRYWLCGLLALVLFCDLKSTARAVGRHWFLLAAIGAVSVLYLHTFWEHRYFPA